MSLSLNKVVLDIIIEKLNLTSIIGHHTVPEESFDNDVEYVLDDNINYKSETVEIRISSQNILQESNN